MGIFGGGSTLEDPAPPLGGVEGSLVVVEGGIDVAEEIPYCEGGFLVRGREEYGVCVGRRGGRTMTDDDATDLVFRYRAMQHQTKRHQNPGEIGRSEDEETEEAQSGFGVAARPDVDEAAAEGGAEEGDGEEGGEAEEDDGGVEEEPREVGWGAAGGFFEEAGVALEEEDVEEEVDGERAEVDEGCQEAPVLGSGEDLNVSFVVILCWINIPPMEQKQLAPFINRPQPKTGA